MTTTVFTIVREDQHAGEILNNLHDNGFSNQEISLLCLAKVRDTAASRGDNFLQGALDWLKTGADLPFAREGLFLVTGQLLLATERVDVAARQISLLLADFGLAGPEAQRYTAKLKRGNILLAVHAASQESRQRATTVFESPAFHGSAPVNQGIS